MFAFFDQLRQLNLASILLRLTLAMLFGGLIGLERGRKGRAAGFRTYMLVCLGAALTMLLSQYEYVMLETRYDEIPIECDNVVLASGFRANHGLQEALEGKPYPVFAIGDCVKPGKVYEAVHGG